MNIISDIGKGRGQILRYSEKIYSRVSSMPKRVKKKKVQDMQQKYLKLWDKFPVSFEWKMWALKFMGWMADE